MNKCLIFVFLILLFIGTVYGYDNDLLTTECEICKFASGIVRYEVKMSNSTLTLIEDIVKDLCYLVGGKPVYKECNEFCNNIQKIANWIENGLNNTQICEKLCMCKQYC